MSEIKLPAASGGGSISIKGPTSSGSDVDLLDTSGNLKLSDDQKVKIGTGDDLQIQHTSGHSRITQSGTGNLIVEVTTTDSDLVLRAEDKVSLQPHNGNEGVVCNAQGSTDLYHNNVKKLETSADGVTVSGAEIKLQNSANASNATVQLIAGEGGSAILELLSDEADDNDDKWKIQADSSHSFYLQNKTSGSWETNLKATGNGAVELYYDNTKRLETTSEGVLGRGCAHAYGRIDGQQNPASLERDFGCGAVTDVSAGRYNVGLTNALADNEHMIGFINTHPINTGSQIFGYGEIYQNSTTTIEFHMRRVDNDEPSISIDDWDNIAFVIFDVG